MTRRSLFRTLLAALAWPWVGRLIPQDTEVLVRWNPAPSPITSITYLAPVVIVPNRKECA